MPIYQCVVPEGAVSPDQRAQMASELTKIHSEATGDSPQLVQALFMEVPEGSAFTAGEPSRMSNIAGYIRAGRSPEVRAQLFERINAAWTEITGIPDTQLKLTLLDIPASWIMQAGMMLPEPGNDEEWLDRVRAKAESLEGASV
ncbi:MAG: tautomerase family protein [Solirubrobacterales bacterium]